MNRKVVWNACYGGFSLSPLAIKMIYERKHPGEKIYFYVQTGYGFDRADRMDVFEKIENPEERTDAGGHDIYCSPKDFGDKVIIPHPKRYEVCEETELYQVCIYSHWELERHDPDLVAVVEELGSKRSSGMCAELKVKDIGDSSYHIDEYDGFETVVTSLGDNYWK